MFDYARNMKLALTDSLRRTGIKAGGGVVIALGAGFLVAALWSFLATELGWGAALASLTIGAVFVAIGVAAMLLAGKSRHAAPTADDLHAEIAARLDLATDAAMGKLRGEVDHFVDRAGAQVNGLVDRVQDGAAAVGLTNRNVNAAVDAVHDAGVQARAAANTNAGSMAKLIGAFAVGVAAASKVQDWRQPPRDAWYDDDLYDDLYDDLADDRRY